MSIVLARVPDHRCDQLGAADDVWPGVGAETKDCM